jgi:HEAT repeat protein
MRKLFIKLVLVLAGLGPVFILTGCGNGEPIYEGRPLAFWRQELRHKDFMARTHAAAVLTVIGANGKEAIPDLMECLKDEQYLVCVKAANALAHMGPEAKVAVPALIDLYKRFPNDAVRSAVADALKQLDPEAAEAAGIQPSDEG